MMRAVITAILLFRAVSGSPLAPDGYGNPSEQNGLTGSYTLTAYVPGNCEYDGLKVNNLNLFQAKVAQYCPFTGSEAVQCPNGTDMAFSGMLHPLSDVPGGQDLYVNVDGFIAITVQHSHSIPLGAWWNYQGWNWTALPAYQRSFHDCPRHDPRYNCENPTGYFNFIAPGATEGGVVACPNPYTPNVTSLYAITPEYNLTGCVELKGLGTNAYSGPNPPVWAY